MLKLLSFTLQKCSKVIMQRTACSKPTANSISSFITLLRKCCKVEVGNSKSVIWKRHRTKRAVLLDNLCNNNLIIFEKSKKQQVLFGYGNKISEHYFKIAEETVAIREFKLNLRKEYAKIKDDFITCTNCVWPTVCACFGIKNAETKVFLNNFCYFEQSQAQTDRYEEVSTLQTTQNEQSPFNESNPFLAPVTVIRELHKGGDRSCLHIELNITGSKMHYNAGDYVGMYPINDKKLVNRLGELCQANLDHVLCLNNTDTTFRSALTHYLEVTAKPTIHTLKELSKYCANEADKEFLCSMTYTTTESKRRYQSWIEDSCRNIVHILEDIKSCQPPIEQICNLLPRLKPRYYSISSSSKLFPNHVHITAVMVQYKTATGRVNKGVATAFLKEKQTSTGQVKVPVFISKSKFHLPTNPETPIVMVGPGTGLAPFRAFIQERQFLRDEGKAIGDTVLYFGCRKNNEDFIYKEELEEYVNKGTLTLKTAFSRDQENKIYVTHLLEQDADLLWKIIVENNGYFYICGDFRNIAVDVRNILVKILSSKGNLSEADAEQYLQKMEAQKRYLADVWS